jgi:hypothetical protein
MSVVAAQAREVARGILLTKYAGQLDIGECEDAIDALGRLVPADAQDIQVIEQAGALLLHAHRDVSKRPVR